MRSGNDGGGRASGGSSPPPSAPDSYVNTIAARGQDVHQDPLRDPGVGQHAAEVHHLGDRHRAAAADLVAGPGVRRRDWRTVIIRSTGGLVGLVPEGLVLLTSVAFLLAAVSLTRQQVLVQELPAVEGLARVDVVCLDKTGTLTVGDIAYECCEPGGGSDRCRRGRGDGARRAGRRPQRERDAEGAGRGPRRSAGLGPHADHRLQLGAQVERGVASPTAAPASSVRPTCCCAADDPLREQVIEKAATGRRVVLLGHSDAAARRARTCPPGMRSARPGVADRAGPARRQGHAGLLRRRRASTSRSSPATTRRPSPRSPAGSASTSPTAGCATPGPSVPTSRSCARSSEQTTVFGRVVAGTEAGARPGAAGRRARRGDDRRRRQRRAGAQGRRHRCRDEQRCAGHEGGRAAGAARRQVLAPAVGARRGPAGDRQRRAGGQPVRRQERDEPDRHRHGRGVRPAVPVPAAAPDAGVGGDHRHPGVLPRSRTEQAAVPPRVPATGAAVRGAGRRGMRRGGDRVVPVGPPGLPDAAGGSVRWCVAGRRCRSNRRRSAGSRRRRRRSRCW